MLTNIYRSQNAEQVDIGDNYWARLTDNPLAEDNNHCSKSIWLLHLGSRSLGFFVEWTDKDQIQEWLKLAKKNQWTGRQGFECLQKHISDQSHGPRPESIPTPSN